MRTVTATLFSSLDGAVEAPDKWQFAFDDEMGAAMSRIVQDQDAVLLGRVTYSQWSQYWPTATDEPFATWINSTPRYVASNTLQSVSEWPNSTLIKGNVADFVKDLRSQDGGTIGTGGSPTLVRYLLSHGLIDELTLLIHPVIAGSGYQRLFPPDAPLSKLALVDSQATSSGTLITTYRPVS